MSVSVYPNNGSTTNAHACAFFSALPRAVGDLRAEGVLTPRDVDVLRELLDHKNRRTSQVDPLQRTLAARMGCSLDTIQRSLARLVKAGLITKKRLRDARGQLGRCVYDLALTLALMPRQAAKLRHGHFGQADPAPPPAHEGKARSTPPITKPHQSGLSEVDSSDVAKADNNVPASPPVPPSPVAVALIAQGVFPKVAAGLVERFGGDRCRQALAALGQRRTVRDKPAWVVGCLQGGWAVMAPAAAAARPPSQHPYQHFSGPLGPPADPLAALGASARVALESAARAALIAEVREPVLSTLRQGRNTRLVEERMRLMLAAPAPFQTL